MFSRSEISPGPVGFHPSFSRVCALEAGISNAANSPSQSKMSSGLFRRDGDDGQFQAAADNLGNLPDGYALFRDRVIAWRLLRFLQRQPVQAGSIEAMRRGPAVEPIADVGRNTLFAGDMDRISNKTLLHRVMDLGKPHDGHADASSRDRSGRLFRSRARNHFRTGRRIVFGGGKAWRRSSPCRCRR